MQTLQPHLLAGIPNHLECCMEGYLVFVGLETLTARLGEFAGHSTMRCVMHDRVQFPVEVLIFDGDTNLL